MELANGWVPWKDRILNGLNDIRSSWETAGAEIQDKFSIRSAKTEPVFTTAKLWSDVLLQVLGV